MKLQIVSVILCILGAFAPRGSAEILPELPSPEAVRAYEHYWNSFDTYERTHLRHEKDRLTQSWNQLRQDYREQDQKMASQQIETLKKAAEQYRGHLQRFPNAPNRAYVLLNLAQIINRLGDHHLEMEPGAGKEYKKESLLILGDLAKDYPQFDRADETLYLRALIFTDLNQEESAQRVWQRLSQQKSASLYVVHAHIALGDLDFQKERAKESFQAYRRAISLLEKLNFAEKDYEMLRLQYRLAWAAYRSAELNQCIEAGIRLLQPSTAANSLSVQKKVEEDAADLIADALYEYNDQSYTRSTLSRRILQTHAAGISLRMLRRYISAGVVPEIIELGEFVMESYPSALQTPEILSIVAEAHEKANNEDRYLAALERLALILPENSLWRMRNQGHFEMIQAMEKKALAATILIASHYYEKGMVNSSVPHFNTAASFFDMLLQFQPNHADSESWRLKKAHCHYFSGELDKADKLYSELKDKHNIKTSTLEVAAYQQVMTREKQWRDSFQQYAGKNLKDPRLIQSLRELEKSIEHFANRFPQLNRSVELLLIGAAANRDMERFSQAGKYWQRVMVSNPTPAQRAMAIRGMVMSKVKSGQPEEIIQVARRYLLLENWDDLGMSLGSELRGVLSIATADASKDLNHKGQVKEAGQLLLAVTQEFANLPNRQRLYRDGAFMLAISGEWDQALQAADDYLASNDREVRGDMVYLRARALEFQLRFKQAAAAYLEMGAQHPQHSRSPSSLERAERLALAEGELSIAAQAAMISAGIEKGRGKKFAAYQRSAQHFAQANEHSKALEAARQALKHAKSRDERMQVEIVMARHTYATGNEVQALKDYQRLAYQAVRYQDNIDKATYQAIYGESTFRQGEEEQARFRDFRIKERSGSILQNIQEKARFFERMVSEYEKSAAANHPDWSPRARFAIGQSAEDFSQEIAEVYMKGAAQLPEATNEQLREQSRRLLQLSRQYHGQNVLLRNREPRLYRNNTWVNQSQVKLAGYITESQNTTDQEQMPFSLTSSLPYQWSL
ncbi:MAG: tetratricopeptide repeat protein [Oligoflexus sp.]